MDKELVPWVKALVIDDEREITTLSTDHNFLSSMINCNYTRLKWEKPQNKVWDFALLDKTEYCKTLDEKLNMIPQDLNNTEELNKAITQAINEALEKVATVKKGGKGTKVHPILEQ